MLMVSVFVPSAFAQAPIGISLLASKASYLSGEPITLEIKVANTSGTPVIARTPFMNQDFHLFIKFTDPDGLTIRTRFQAGGPEPGPGIQYQGKQAVPVEVIAAGAERVITVDDARFYYDLAKVGLWKAQVETSLETFSAFVTTPEGVQYGFLEDEQRAVFDPLTSNIIYFSITSPQPQVSGQIEVEVAKLVTGSGNQPTAKKSPLKDVPVRLFRLANVPAALKPVNFKTYEQIYNTVTPIASGFTDLFGLAKFSGIAKNDYVVIASYKGSPDFKHMGSPMDATDPAWGTANPIRKHLMVMEKANGKTAPGKTTRLTGSELLITEPEYVLWDSDQELYPFVFESVGDWNVTVTVTPPEGFVADRRFLSDGVNDQLEALQFTITDVGSRWEETGVTYQIRHGGKNEIIKTKIGVKLSHRLAEKKGLGIYGHTKGPEPFTMGGAKK